MASTTRREHTVTLGYWDYVYVQDSGIITGTMAGMMGCTEAERLIRQRSFVGADVRLELVHHTYQIPATDVS
jgi:hypothetical protein